jgi:tetratricopeptide (TPR) repeat protein
LPRSTIRESSLRPQVKNVEAYRHYLKGRFLRHTKNDHGGALREYEEALRLDSSHGPSWVGVAEVNVLAAHYCLIPTASAYAKAQQALATAARLQGDSAEGLYVQGLLAYVHWRWAARDEAYRCALHLEPSHVQVLGSYGLVLAAHGRLDDAREYFDRAREADPLASFPCALTGVGLLTGGEPEESLRHFEDALGFEKENTLALWGSGTAHVALGRLDEGLAMLEKAVVHVRRAPFMVGLLAWGLAVAGRIEEARTLLEELRSRPQPAPAVVSEAWLLGVLGDRGRARPGGGRAPGLPDLHGASGFRFPPARPEVRRTSRAHGSAGVVGPKTGVASHGSGRRLLIGQTLAHYRITAAIGAGGMGEVYRATDTVTGGSRGGVASRCARAAREGWGLGDRAPRTLWITTERCPSRVTVYRLIGCPKPGIDEKLVSPAKS